MVHQNILKVARIIRNNPKFEMLSRFGYITNGILHTLIGIAIIALALGASEEVDQSGVLVPLAHSWYGFILLILIVIGLVSLGIWQIVRALVMRKEPHADRKWPHQLSELAKGLAYIALGLTSLTYIFANAGFSSSVSQTQSFAAHLLTLPLGQVLLGIIGVLIAALGANFMYRGISRRFLKSLHENKIKFSKTITVLGCIGYCAKGLTFLLVGFLFFQAALNRNPGQASGLDGAFRTLLGLPLGTVLVCILGIGFIVYAVYCVARGRYGKL